jgi:hypothetical protein
VPPPPKEDNPRTTPPKGDKTKCENVKIYYNRKALRGPDDKCQDEDLGKLFADAKYNFPLLSMVLAVRATNGKQKIH